MRLDRLLLTLCLATSVQSSELFAQQITAKTCDVPVVVTDFYNRLVRDLQVGDFSIRLGGTAGVVHSASIDGSPKRIVLILDASRNIPDDEWKLETETAESLVGHARPADRVALLVIGAEDSEASFLPSEEVVAGLQKLARSQGPERTYDALLGAAHRLDPVQFGDAIFLIGHDEDFGSAATFNQVREQLLKRKVRFYGISFTDRLANFPRGVDLNKPLPKGFGLSKLESLSFEAGYAFSFFAVHDLNIPGQTPGFKNYLADLYAGIAEPYRLSIGGLTIKNQTNMDVNIAHPEVRGIRKDDIHYPHALFPCAVPVSAP